MDASDDASPIRIRACSWTDEQTALMRVRDTVFVREQGVPRSIEIDGHDPESHHVVAETASGEPVGTARLLNDGQIGRCAVLAEWRGRGIGSRLVAALLDTGRERGYTRFELHAQVAAIPFYEKLGFSARGPVFGEAGIPHRTMVLELATR